MKHILISVLLLICSFSTFSQKFETNGALEFGYEDKLTAFYYYNKYGSLCQNLVKLSPYIGVLYFDAKYKNVTFFTNTKTYFCKGRDVYFKPIQNEYYIGLKYTYKIVTLEASHMCSHSIDKLMYKDGYDRITVKINIF